MGGKRKRKDGEEGRNREGPTCSKGSGDRRPYLTEVNRQRFFTFWRNTNYTLCGLLYILLQIFSIDRERKSVKNYENWLTSIRQNYCNNTKGDVFNGPCCTS